MGARRRVAKPSTPRWQRPAWLKPRLLGAGVLLSVLGTGLGLGGWSLAQPDTLPIRRVQVAGEFHYLDRHALDRALGGLASGGFFNVDVRAVKKAAESLPWVDRASVRRVWPDTLRLEISEQVPLARWGEAALLNVRGEMFKPATLPQDLPRFAGPKGAAVTVAEHYQWLATRLAPLGVKVAGLRLNERRAWEMSLDNGLHVLLGRAPQDEQLLRFVQAYPRLLAPRIAQVERVDLRYTNGFAVQWRPGAEPTQSASRVG
jgi:cell division protein FtsQ